MVNCIHVPLTMAQNHVYTGEAACRECHHNQGARNQFNPWRLSKHAQAYAALAKPEAIEIARLLGIRTDPHDSPICLGCHTTASNTEEWERDPGFRLEDGVQCEYCHGPGSDYSDSATMLNHEAAEKAGLVMPIESFCLICHLDKPSHSKVLQVNPFDYPSFLKKIDHSGVGGELKPSHPSIDRKPKENQLYSGVTGCIPCHQNHKSNYIFSQWRSTAHAGAYAVLGTLEAKQIASKQGITEHPQESPECLRCHTTGYGIPADQFAEGFDIADGIQCESCHGPANNHAAYYFENKSTTAAITTVGTITEVGCKSCHEDEIHGKQFDYLSMLETVKHQLPQEMIQPTPVYKTPVNLTLSKDGSRLLIACEASNSVIVVDTQLEKVIEEIEVQHLPHDVCLSPDERWAYVSNRGSDSVSVIDLQSNQMIKNIPVGDEPHGLITNQQGSLLYTANTGTGDISVIDTGTLTETKRLSAARGAWGISRSPEGAEIYVTNNLSYLTGFREPMLSEVTVLDSNNARVINRLSVPDTNLLQGITHSPDGKMALFTLIRTKNLLPISRLSQGWVMTNGLGVLWKNDEVDQLLLDEFDDFFSDPTDICITPDGKYAFVTSGGNNSVAVIDMNRMVSVLENATKQERIDILPNHLGIPVEFVVKRIPVGINPRGITVPPDGNYIYTANALEDSISIIAVSTLEEVKRIDLGGAKTITLERKGERIFHSAENTFGLQFSCHSCHPDGGVDNITYDIEADGVGVNPVDNRTLRGILDTGPFKWSGKNKTLSRQCGPRLAVFFTRIDPFTPEQVEALERYICSIPSSPNRHRQAGTFTPAQRKGKSIFFRTVTNSGEAIPLQNRCYVCHPPPYYTNRQKVYTGAITTLDTDNTFDVPHLNNIYETAPYLHDGRAHTLEEIWTRYNPYDEHGFTNDLTKDQLNNLIEFLKTL